MTSFFRSDRGPLLALVFIVGALLFTALGATEFWEPDEPEFALLARTMAENGDWVVPTQNGLWYAEKPPLLYWTVIVATGGGAAFEGDAAWAPLLARLPSALAGFLLVIGLYFFAAPALGRRAAFLAALVLATTGLFVVKSRTLQTDVLFAALTAGSIMAFLAADRAPRSRPPGWAITGAWLLLAAAWLAKGPLALVIAGLAVGGHLATRPKGSVRRFLSGPGHWGGVVLFLMLVVPWYLLVLDRLGPDQGWAFLEENLVRQNLGRTAGSWSHAEPAWFYLLRLPVDLLPWTPVIAAALVWAWRRARKDDVPFALTGLAWFVPGFVALSLVSSKQGKYLLPLYPALALLAGAWLDRVARRQPLARSPRLLTGAVAAILGLAGLVALSAPLLPIAALAEHADVARALVPGGAVLLLGALVAVVRLVLLARPERAVVDLAVAVALGGALLFALALPRLDDRKSARGFCEHVAARVAPETDLGIFGSYRSAYPYYLRRRLTDLRVDNPAGAGEGRRAARLDALARATAFLDRPGRGWLIMQAGHLDRWLSDDVRSRLDAEPTLVEDVGGKVMVLIGERPAD